MNNLVTFFSLSLTQLGIYLYLKNSLKNFLEHYTQNYLGIKKATDVKVQKIEIENVTRSKTMTNKVEDNDYAILNKSLRHLEFITQFEMYLEDKNYKNFSTEFLQEFEKIKIEAQLTTLKTTSKLNDKRLRAA